MFPVGDPVPAVKLTPVVGEMLQLELEMLAPESEKLVKPPLLMLAPALLATKSPLGVGHAGVTTVIVAVAFAVVVVQAPVELAT